MNVLKKIAAILGRIVVVIGKILISLLFLLIVLLAGLYVWLGTGPGERMLAQGLEKGFGKIFIGKLRVESVLVRLNGRIRMDKLQIFSAESELVTSFDRLELKVRLPRLLKKKISVDGIEIQKPFFAMAKSCCMVNTWSFTRAFIPRRPSPKKEETPNEWNINIDDFKINLGEFRYIPDPGERQIRVGDITLSVPSTNIAPDLNMGINLADLDVFIHSGTLHRPLNVRGKFALNKEMLEINELQITSKTADITGHVQLPRVPDTPAASKLAIAIPAKSLTDFGINNPTPWKILLTTQGPLANLNAKLEAILAGKITADLQGNLARQDITEYRLSLAVENLRPAELGIGSGLPNTSVNAKTEIVGQNGKNTFVTVEDLWATAMGLTLKGSGKAIKRADDTWRPDASVSLKGRYTPPAPPQTVEKNIKPPIPLDISIQSQISEREFSLDSIIKRGPKGFLAAKASGNFPFDFSKININSLQIHYPQNRLTLVGKTTLILKPYPQVNNFTLIGAGQSLSLAGTFKAPRYNASLTARNINLGQFPYDALDLPFSAKGILNIVARGRGTTAFPMGKAHVSLQGGGIEFHDTTTKKPSFTNLALTIDAELSSKGVKGIISGAQEKSSLQATFSGTRDILNLANSHKPLLADIKIANVDLGKTLATFAQGATLPPNFGGTGSATAHLKGSLAHLEGQVDLVLNKLSYENLEDLNLNLHSVLLLTKEHSSVQLALADNQSMLMQTDLEFIPGKNQNGLFGFPKTKREIANSTISLRTHLQDIDLARFVPVRESLPISGIVSGNIELKGKLAEPSFTSNVDIRNLPPNALGKLTLAANYANAKVNVHATSTASPQNYLSIEGSLPISVDVLREEKVFFIEKDAQIQADVKANGANLQVFRPLLPFITDLQGTLMGEVKISGNYLTPQARGRLIFTDGVLGVRGVRTFHDIKMTTNFLENEVALENFSAVSGGSFSLKGTLKGIYEQERSFNGEVVARNFMILPVRFSDAALSTRLLFQGTLSQTLLRTDVKTDERQGLVLTLPTIEGFKTGVSLARNPDIRVTTDDEGIYREPQEATLVAIQNNSQKDTEESDKEENKPRATPARQMEINIVAPRNIRIEGVDVALEFGLDKMQIKNTESGDMIMAGTVKTMREGRLNLIGRTFHIEESRVTFLNTKPQLGQLDLNTFINIQPEGKALIKVGGILQKPVLKMSASEEVGQKSQDEVAMAILSGEWQSQGFAGMSSAESTPKGKEAAAATADEASTPSGEQGTANKPSLGQKAAGIGAGAVANLLVSQIESSLLGKTNFIFNLNLQNVDNPEERKASVQVSRYLSPKLYVTYENRLLGADPNSNKNQVNIDYSLSTHWKLEGYFGDNRESGASLVWKNRF